MGCDERPRLAEGTSDVHRIPRNDVKPMPDQPPLFCQLLKLIFEGFEHGSAQPFFCGWRGAWMVALKRADVTFKFLKAHTVGVSFFNEPPRSSNGGQFILQHGPVACLPSLKPLRKYFNFVKHLN